MDIQPGEYWKGLIKTQRQPVSVVMLCRQLDSFYREWVLIGCDKTYCGEIEWWATGEGRKVEHYNDGKPVPIKDFVQNFEIKLLEKVENDGWEEITNEKHSYFSPKFKETPVVVPSVVRFYGVEWKEFGCTANDSICSGKASFVCRSWEIVEQK